MTVHPSPEDAPRETSDDFILFRRDEFRRWWSQPSVGGTRHTLPCPVEQRLAAALADHEGCVPLAEVAALRAERDEAVRLLRHGVDACYDAHTRIEWRIEADAFLARVSTDPSDNKEPKA